MGSDNKPLNLNQKMKFMISLLSLIFSLETNVSGHARLLEPPSRSSMWRFGYDNPPDYQDNEGFCGGYQVQWEVNNGKCGICGDRFDATVKEHEAPYGKFANGLIVRNYAPGDVMNVTVDVTANHRGHFTFRMCPVTSPNQDPEQECFDKPENTLNIVAMVSSFYWISTLISQCFQDSQKFILPDQLVRQYHLAVQLPQNLLCEHCVLQWTYTTGNNWGWCQDGSGQIGCGPQETFRACSDFKIEEKESRSFEKTSEICLPIGVYSKVPGMIEWCRENCGKGRGDCSSSKCKCYVL